MSPFSSTFAAGLRRWLAPMSQALVVWAIVVTSMVVLRPQAQRVWAAEATRAQALRQLPPSRRSAIFVRRLDGYLAFCSSGLPATLTDHSCREDATLLSLFPECDSACRQNLEANLQ